MFERRLGLFSAGFDKDGVLFAQTAWGDYPQFMPGKKESKFNNAFTGWMLLSYKKNATASSSIDSLSVANAFDENIRTYWSANTGKENEWLCVDLGSKCTVNAIQINFAEHETNIFGRQKGVYYQYKIECSSDGKTWQTVINKSKNTIDAPHDYLELDKPILTRYLKLINIDIPDGKFAVSGFRIFGKAMKPKPGSIKDFNVKRDLNDTRNAKLEWPNNKTATGYIINYGVDKNKLYNHLMVYGKNSAELKTLNTGTDYYFSIDSFNEAGVTNGNQIKEAKANL
jgi:hypothetical protein